MVRGGIRAVVAGLTAEATLCETRFFYEKSALAARHADFIASHSIHDCLIPINVQLLPRHIIAR